MSDNGAKENSASSDDFDRHDLQDIESRTEIENRKKSKKKVIEIEQSDPIFIASANAQSSSKKNSAKAVESSLR
jgi:hypothetical protein